MKKIFTIKLSITLALVILAININISNADLNPNLFKLYDNINNDQNYIKKYNEKSLELFKYIDEALFLHQDNIYTKDSYTKIENAINKAYSVFENQLSSDKDKEQQISILKNLKSNLTERENMIELNHLLELLLEDNSENLTVEQSKQWNDKMFYIYSVTSDGTLVKDDIIGYATDEQINKGIQYAKELLDMINKNYQVSKKDEKLSSNIQKNDIISNFKDAKEITWSKDSITKVVKKGIMKGSNGKFLPKATVTRAEVAKVIANILGKDKENIDADISDLDDNKWYADAVKTVVLNSIFDLEKNNTFRPESNITRAELFIAIAKLKNLSPLANDEADDILSAYTDKNDISSNDLGYIAALVKEKIVSGSNNKLNPKSVITREQMAAIFANIIQ